METGVLTVSLNVSDLNASKEFYEKLGFTLFSGSVNVDFIYMKKGHNLIKLLQLYEWENYDENYLTLNPDWNDNLKTKEKLEDFTEIRNSLIKKGIQIENSTQLEDPDVGSFFIRDPDGNKILIEEIGL